MPELGWVTVYKDGIIGGLAERQKVENRARDDETVCAVVPADEWDALTDVEAAVERAARARCHELGRTWDLLPDHMHDEWRRFVRPIVLAALGITP